MRSSVLAWAVAAVAAVAAEHVLPDEPEFLLKIVDQDIVSEHRAFCLSGTPPGYYFRPGSAANASRFKIHFEGGGWCFNPEDCFWRLTIGDQYPGWLANSSAWPRVASDLVSPWGMMAWNDTDTAGYTSVWANYCDGSSFASNREDQIEYNGTKMWLRGKAILTAILQDLDRHAGLLSTATEVIISGTSAGGLATYLHAEHIRDVIPAAASLVALPDAGFFVDEPNVHGDYVFREHVQAGWSMFNASSGVNDACIAHYAPADQWRCFMAQYTAPFITRVPLYMLNSAIDKASMGLILQVGCALDVNTTGTCNATQVKAIADWRLRFLQLADQWVFSQPAHATTAGSYITSCPQHEEVCRDQDWENVRVEGVSDQANFGAWRAGASAVATRKRDGPWPNPTCQDLPMHGPC